MKNFIIGFFSIIMIILVGIGVSMTSGKSMRANELDSSLGTAMEQCMENLKVKEVYNINDEKEFVADFIENMLVKTESDATYKITVYSVDMEKGLLDVGVTETYKQLFKAGKVSARKTVILDTYQNREDIYYTVSFKYGDTVIKQIQVYGGSYLTASSLPESDSYKGWKRNGITYTKDNISNVAVTENMEFIGIK